MTVAWLSLLVTALPVTMQRSSAQTLPAPLPAEASLAAPAEVVPLPAIEPVCPEAFNLAELEQIALRHNPAICRAAAHVRAACGERVQAGLYPNPVVAYSGEEMGDDGTAGKQGGIIGQEFITAGKRQLATAVASRKIARLQQEFAVARYRVLTDVRMGYSEVLIAQRRVELTRQLLDVAKEALRTAEDLFKAKEASRVDVLQAKVEVDSTSILMTNAQNRLKAAWRILAASVGIPDMPQTTLVGNLDQPHIEMGWDETLYRLLTESPQMAAARAEVSRARCNVQLECAERIPNVNLATSLHRDNVTGDTIAGVEFEIPVPIFDRNQGNIIRAEAELIAAKREVARLELSLQQRLAEKFERYSNASNQVKKYRETILPNAKASLELVAAGYEQAEFGYLTLLMAQRTYFHSNLAYLDSLSALNESGEEIEGFLLSGSLGGE